MNIGVAIVSTKKWKLASFSRSVLIFGASPARFVALMNIENPCYSRPSSKRLKRVHLAHPQRKRPVGFRHCSSGDLVEGGIGDLIGFYLRSSVNQGDFACKHLQPPSHRS